MCLIDDNRKFTIGVLGDTFRDYRKLLQRGYNNQLMLLNSLFQVLRGTFLINLNHLAGGLLELPEVALHLAVERNAVIDHDYTVKQLVFVGKVPI